MGIRDFTIKYGHQLNLDRTKEAKSLKDKLFVLWSGDFLAIELARQELEHEVCEHYKRYVVRSRLNRILNKAMKCNVSTQEEEV